MAKRSILSISSSPTQVFSTTPIRTYTINQGGQTLYVTSDQLNLTDQQVRQKVADFQREQKQFSENMQRSFDQMSESFSKMTFAPFATFAPFGQMQMQF
jgi:hypothetical protein